MSSTFAAIRIYTHSCISFYGPVIAYNIRFKIYGLLSYLAVLARHVVNLWSKLDTYTVHIRILHRPLPMGLASPHTQLFPTCPARLSQLFRCSLMA
jgi:hypothetical protein